ncbi:response regulator transcription factor [Thalassotalea montiporae]
MNNNVKATTCSKKSKVIHLLVVEDCQQVAGVLFDYFESTPDDIHYEIDYAATGTLGLKLAQEHHFDCIILDIMLPGVDGLTVCKTLREAGNSAPIVMLTARDTNSDTLDGLTSGADDYIVKPFDLELLEARIHAVLRRSAQHSYSHTLSANSIKIDTKTLQVWRYDCEVKLNPSCFKILKLLVERFPNAVSKQQIEETLWPNAMPEQDVLRKHIYQLRQKLDKPFESELLKTIPKLGYRIANEES